MFKSVPFQCLGRGFVNSATMVRCFVPVCSNKVFCRAAGFYSLHTEVSKIPPQAKEVTSHKERTPQTEALKFVDFIQFLCCDCVVSQALLGHTDAVTCLTASSAYHIVVSGSRDRTCIIWDLNKLSFVTQLRGHRAPVSALCINELTVGRGLNFSSHSR